MQSDATEYRITWERPGVGKLSSASTYRNLKVAEEIAATWTKNIGVEHRVEPVEKESTHAH